MRKGLKQIVSIIALVIYITSVVSFLGNFYTSELNISNHENLFNSFSKDKVEFVHIIANIKDVSLCNYNFVKTNKGNNTTPGLIDSSFWIIDHNPCIDKKYYDFSRFIEPTLSLRSILYPFHFFW